MKIIIKKGDKFGMLTVVKLIEIREKSQQYWLFRCECGREKIIRYANVKNGNTKSCGCLNSEIATKRNKENTIHGMAGTRTYKSWRSMKDRCLNKNAPNYKEYGGRGITICHEWLNTFQNFLADMGERPSNTSIDRINNDGNYNPNNCRWADPKTQANNRRERKILILIN